MSKGPPILRMNTLTNMATLSLRDVFLTCLCIALTPIAVSYLRQSLTQPLLTDPPVMIVPNKRSRATRKESISVISRPTCTRKANIGDGTLPRGVRNKPRSKIHYEDIPHRVAIVSMSSFSSGHFVLPRTIKCNNNKGGEASVLIERGNLSNVAKAGVVIVSGKIDSDDLWKGLQQQRQMRQVWVMSTEESPWVSRNVVPPPHLNHIRFNLTVTYQPSADISVPYGFYSPFKNSGKSVRRQKFTSMYSRKSKLMLWVSSHCVTRMWRRSHLVHDLSSLLPGGMDTYGACGELSCELKDRTVCNEVFRKYKFVAAMENSCCGGYITEKFWNTLNVFEAVPVVVGAPRTDYEKLAPPNSFIHADDFDTMKGLADYILKVSNNKTLYDSYFDWRNNGEIHQTKIVDILALSDVGICRTFDTLRRGTFGNGLVFDPYGADWLGGCNYCGEHSWLTNYSNYDGAYC